MTYPAVGMVLPEHTGGRDGTMPWHPFVLEGPGYGAPCWMPGNSLELTRGWEAGQPAVELHRQQSIPHRGFCDLYL